RDVTDRKLAKKALHHLNQALEEEVKRIAHALHDEAGQLLASVHIGLAEIARDLPAHSAQRLHDVRGLLDNLGLRPALEFLADGVSRRTGLQIVVNGSTDVRLPTSTETAVYRVVQQALTNVTKHARATRVTIMIERSGPCVRWILRDDGVGFDVPTVLGRRGSRGLGLIGIQERLHGIGGTLEITSTPRGGTQLLISIPVEADS